MSTIVGAQLKRGRAAYTFRGRPPDLAAVVRFAGLDVRVRAGGDRRRRERGDRRAPPALQPVRRLAGRRLVAYSLGLSRRGVEAATLLPAVIEATRPRLLR